MSTQRRLGAPPRSGSPRWALWPSSHPPRRLSGTTVTPLRRPPTLSRRPPEHPREPRRGALPRFHQTVPFHARHRGLKACRAPRPRSGGDPRGQRLSSVRPNMPPTRKAPLRPPAPSCTQARQRPSSAATPEASLFESPASRATPRIVPQTCPSRGSVRRPALR